MLKSLLIYAKKRCRSLLYAQGSLLTLFLFLHNFTYANQDEVSYLQKYLNYTFLIQNLPKQDPDPLFLNFIESSTPLSNKLREKWLFLLASHHDWTRFHLYYRDNQNTSLHCLEQLALFHLGFQQEALQDSLPLWLSDKPLPITCLSVFDEFLKHQAFTPDQIQARLRLTLMHNQPLMALRLLQKTGSAQKTIQDIQRIMNRPINILKLEPSSIADVLYLFGLKLLVVKNMPLAMQIWQDPQTAKKLNHELSQNFLAHLALYKAVQQEKDAPQWFAQVEPYYQNTLLKDWEIRYALVQKNWPEILKLTAPPTSLEPNGRYWRARALEMMGQHEEAKILFAELANKRSYYGFLASLHLQQDFQFEYETTAQDQKFLQTYKVILDEIKGLYQKHQFAQASKILADFSLELSKPEKAILMDWIGKDLHWYGKSVYLSSADEELANHLLLRFPLLYSSTIQEWAAHYHVPKELVYAMIRQESAFFDDIKSPAGACGLMQILPRTAKLIAKQAKISYHKAEDLYIIEKNIQIGTAYLKNLSQQFHGHPLLVAAAYNAGPKQVKYWMNNHPPTEIDIWIETLPWQETRNYLKNVISFYAVYQFRMHKNPNLAEFLSPFRVSELRK